MLRKWFLFALLFGVLGVVGCKDDSNKFETPDNPLTAPEEGNPKSLGEDGEGVPPPIPAPPP